MKRRLDLEHFDTLMGILRELGRESVISYRKQAIIEKRELEMEMKGMILGGTVTVRFEFDGRNA